MADYYPLLAKAAAGLSGASTDARQAMYARARKALLGQLRALDPPVAEEDIAAESAALDEAIARVEAELFPPARPAPAAPVSAPVATPAPVAPPEPAPTVSAPPVPAPPVAAPAEPAPSSPAPATSPVSSAPPRSPVRRPTNEALASAAAIAPAAPSPSQAAPESAGTEELAAADPVTPAAPLDDHTGDLRVRPRERPLAPKPPPPRSQMRRVWILGGVAAVLVAAVAAAALKLRDSPEEFARLKPVAAPTSEPTAGGKIAERVGRDDSSQSSATQTAPAQNAPRTNVTAAPATGTEPAVTQAPIPVAQRAALLVEAPDLDSKVRTFIGSTVWRLDTTSVDAGQPLGTSVHADVDIPDAKVRLTLDIRKNTDAALPASDTIEVRFTLAPDSTLPGIKQISVPQMRREENPNGDALAGVPVKITDTYFLVGLAQGDFEKRNSDLLRSRSWFDIPIQLTDNRIAKLTIEKGAAGDRILTDALSSWGQ